MYYQTINAFLDLLFLPIDLLIQLIKYIFADKETRDYIKKVPRFCREVCDDVFECRNPDNDWKCYQGCMWVDNDPKQKAKFKKKKKVKYHKNGLPIETRYNEEDYKYYR